jgi:tight adherence protein C
MSVTVTYIPILISALVFVAMLFLFLGVFQYVRQNAVSRGLIEKIHWGSENGGLLNAENLSLTNGEEKRSVFRFLQSLGNLLFPSESKDYSQMKINFLKAGLPRTNVPTIFWGAKCFLGMFSSASFILARISVFKLVDPTMSLAICLLLGISGFYAPDIWLRVRTARRKDKILKGLPDALDILVVCVEAGMGLDEAIKGVAEEIRLTNKPLSDELKLFNLELLAGKPRQDALKNLALRTGLEDMNSLVTLIIEADQFGTSISKSLRVYSDSFRTKRYLRAEEVAARLPVKLIVTLILFIFPSLFVVILGPAAIRIYQIFLNR